MSCAVKCGNARWWFKFRNALEPLDVRWLKSERNNIVNCLWSTQNISSRVLHNWTQISQRKRFLLGFEQSNRESTPYVWVVYWNRKPVLSKLAVNNFVSESFGFSSKTKLASNCKPSFPCAIFTISGMNRGKQSKSFLGLPQ